ncbi:hypothetical protein KQ945_01935 [Bacillus subtilis subsp. subtilis]|nr:hypothetical protein [Bacillus subtilis subsp. subtilis]
MYLNRIQWAAVLLAAGVLATARGHAADRPGQDACASLSLLPIVRDVGVTALDVQVRRGRCEVAIEAASMRALYRQQQVVNAISQAACGAGSEATADKRGLPALSMRLPA